MNREWLKNKIKEVGLTQERFAERMGLRKPAISELYNGKRSLSVIEASNMAEILGCSLDDVLSAYTGNYPEDLRPYLDEEILENVARAVLSFFAKNQKTLAITIEDLPKFIIRTYQWVYAKKQKNGHIANDNEIKAWLEGAVTHR